MWPPATPARCISPAATAKAILPANTTMTPEDQGTLTFTATLETAGTQSIKATDTNTSSVTGTQSGIAVQAAGAQSFTVIGFPATVTAGLPYTFTVIAYDAYGNVATGYTGTVHFTSSDVKAILPANTAMTAAEKGTATFTATFNTAGTQSITASDTVTTSITGTASVTVNAVTATASLVKTDTTTEGTWIGSYGTQGYDLINSSSSLPSYATVTPTGDLSWTWAASTTDPRALQVAGGAAGSPRAGTRPPASRWTST